MRWRPATWKRLISPVMSFGGEFEFEKDLNELADARTGARLSMAKRSCRKFGESLSRASAIRGSSKAVSAGPARQPADQGKHEDMWRGNEVRRHR